MREKASFSQEHPGRAPLLTVETVNEQGVYATQCAPVHFPCIAGEGEHVADSPYQVQVEPGPPAPLHSTVTGQGRRAAAAGCLASFEVVARDAHGNACIPFSQQSPQAADGNSSRGSGSSSGSSNSNSTSNNGSGRDRDDNSGGHAGSNSTEVASTLAAPAMPLEVRFVAVLGHNFWPLDLHEAAVMVPHEPGKLFSFSCRKIGSG